MTNALALQRPASAPHSKPSDLLLPLKAVGFVWRQGHKLSQRRRSNNNTKDIHYDSESEESILSKGETICVIEDAEKEKNND